MREELSHRGDDVPCFRQVFSDVLPAEFRGVQPWVVSIVAGAPQATEWTDHRATSPQLGGHRVLDRDVPTRSASANRRSAFSIDGATCSRAPATSIASILA